MGIRKEKERCGKFKGGVVSHISLEEPQEQQQQQLQQQQQQPRQLQHQ
ncbi:hypothetical protein Hamer_G002031 [Homarus americanus]|uniref:Uncharacterized protein n=1 Tax=Homarus americanus TaxID=6706 RepID=A0A8J5JRP0_HOMAM|nr:hypothetical protein Hamer_G002031 [Homarus americanus]